MDIVDFCRLDAAQLRDAARILREAIAGPSYKQPGEAEAETASFLAGEERFALAALDGAAVRGWIGAVRGYSHALQLHPLVVDPSCQRRGIGRALVAALEARAVAEGYLTVHLGTDDEIGGTSLFGADLFPDALAKLAQIQPTPAGHPYFFYRRLGYEPIGLIPDANGFGKPDILMAKRVARPPSTGSV
jgi:aminoglycoside 6'-N-acetyltransferase I